jgi:hypothetical protein
LLLRANDLGFDGSASVWDNGQIGDSVFRGSLTSVEVFRLNRPIALSAFRGQAKGRQNVMLSVA